MLYSLLWLLGVGVGEGQDILRKAWVHSLFTQRVQQGKYYYLLQEMRLSDLKSHFRYLRMPKERFDCLLFSHFQSPECIVGSPIRHKKEPSDWLTLRFLAYVRKNRTLCLFLRKRRKLRNFTQLRRMVQNMTYVTQALRRIVNQP